MNPEQAPEKKYRKPHPIRHWNFAATPRAENYERETTECVPRQQPPAATHNLFTIADRNEEPKRRHTKGTILKLDNQKADCKSTKSIHAFSQPYHFTSFGRRLE
jgi:hypothetical protein